MNPRRPIQHTTQSSPTTIASAAESRVPHGSPAASGPIVAAVINAVVDSGPIDS